MIHRKAPKTVQIREKGSTSEKCPFTITSNLSRRKSDSVLTHLRYRKTKVFLPKEALRTRFADPEDDALAEIGAKAKPMTP